jgi:hypothetical protein
MSTEKINISYLLIMAFTRKTLCYLLNCSKYSIVFSGLGVKGIFICKNERLKIAIIY